ncbi:MAG: SDR family oxidoreductase [Candidatus Rokubacteria bacterium]|nr:SDR family oxidoreductase [Candidatus Rokubacteria bacterium]
MKQLEGKVAIVTGGGTGIGRSTALMLAAEGAEVIVAGRRRAPLDEVVAEIERAGGRAWARGADLERREECEALGRAAVAERRGVDILVNNAGHSSRVRNIQWLTQAEWDSVLAVNLTGVYALTQAVLPSMIERGGGTIVTVSSLAALQPGLLSGAVYGAAKAGVRNLMAYLHNTFRDKGIRATTVLPAEVDTPIMDLRPVPPDEKARATMMAAEDVAAAIVLCCTLPMRTVIQEIVMHPTYPRDLSAEIEANRRIGEPAAR